MNVLMSTPLERVLRLQAAAAGVPEARCGGEAGMRSHYDITNTDHLPEVTLEGFETVTMRVRRHAREQHDIGFTWHSWRDSPFEREGCDLVETIKEWSHRAAMIANQKMANAQKKNRTAMERWRKGGREQFVKGDTSVGLLRTMLARQRW